MSSRRPTIEEGIQAIIYLQKVREMSIGTPLQGMVVQMTPQQAEVAWNEMSDSKKEQIMMAYRFHTNEA